MFPLFPPLTYQKPPLLASGQILWDYEGTVSLAGFFKLPMSLPCQE